MKLLRLQLSNFRNFKSLSWQPNAEINYLYGQNGAGKTSILEAIYMLASSKSFRSNQVSRVIHAKEQTLDIFGLFQNEQIDLPVGLRKTMQGDTIIKINGEVKHKASSLAAIQPVSLITQESFTLLTSGPKNRRKFLDWAMFHVEPAFHHHWKTYSRLLAQRNALLKKCHKYQELKVWDKELQAHAESIDGYRQQYLEKLDKKVRKIALEFFPGRLLEVKLQPGWDTQIELQPRLEQMFELERRRGFTTIGPHKADLKISCDGEVVQEYFSRGQQKLLIYLLYLAQLSIMYDLTQNKATLLIDDVISELDSHHLAVLFQQLLDHIPTEQIFITAIEPQAEIIQLCQAKGLKLFHVEHNEVYLKQ